MTERARGERGNGAAGAALLACGLGCFALGVIALAADGWKALAGWMIWYRPTGPLSGVSTLALVIWLGCWWVLDRRWRGRDVAMGKVGGVAVVLLVLGVLLTFPPFGDVLIGK